MAKMISRRQRVEAAEYVHVFALVDDPESGWEFCADENGKYRPMAKEAQENLRYCLDNPSKVTDRGIKKYYHRWTEPAVLECDCGEKVVLDGEVCGASQCPRCGRWYNLAGQEVISPDGWDF